MPNIKRCVFFRRILFCACFFCAGFFDIKNQANAENGLIISEILVGGEKADEEFIELYNLTENDINLKNLPLKVHFINADGKKDTSKTLIFNQENIKAGGYYTISSREYKEKFSNIADAYYGSGELAKNWSVYISKSAEDMAAVLDFIKPEICGNNYSYSFNGIIWKCTAIITPGKENQFDKIVELKTYSDKIYINEVLPNPKENENENEYIEIYNAGESEADLTGWTLCDASKSCKKYIFPDDSIIKSKNYFVVYRKDFDFAMNNSGEEAVYLLNPNEEIISSVSYSYSVKENVSYNFTGENWRWSKFLTPGAENKFNNPPAIEVKIDKKAYKNVYADFEVEANDPDKDEIKVAWDFGDNHKSYKQKTRHKYQEMGKYEGSVKISDGSEESVENFTLEVEDFPEPKVRIVALAPNPKGNDSENEWIKVKNKSKKKINLQNWSIATGKNSKKMANHPIYEDLIINPGKEAIITREISKFTLHNEKARVELRYPDGKTAHRAKYKKENGVKDDEVYEKIKGEGWKWTREDEILKTENNETQENENIETTEQEKDEMIKTEEELEEETLDDFIGKQSGTEKENQIALAANETNGKLAKIIAGGSGGKVLGAMAIKTDIGEYIFTGNINYPKKKHYAVVFLKELFWKINLFADKAAAKFNNF